MPSLALNQILRSLPAVTLALSCVSATPVTVAEEDCAAAGGVTPLCGFQRPEDFAVLPGAELLLISEYGALNGSRPGRLSTLRAGDGARATLFPLASPAPASSADAGWGDPSCPGPPGSEFSPHGIHHVAGSGKVRVLVVNHGGREAVELFELHMQDGGRAATLAWRGCVVAPDGSWLNDVVGLPAGGLAVTNMVERGTAEEALFEVERTRADSGEVLAWSRESGWQTVPGTAGALPNGIEVSADGATLYVNYYFGDRVAAIDRASGKRLWQTAIPSPDNASWAADGRLYVASHDEPLRAVLACNAAAAAFCPLRFSIVALDALSGAAATVLTGGGAAPFGAATVAIEFDGKLYLGSFTGERMAYVARPAAR